MLQTVNPLVPQSREHAGASSGAAQELYSSVLDFVRRHWPTIVGCTVVCLVFGVVYLMATPPSFTAQAMMIIDNRKVGILQQQSVVGDIPVDAATVESQVEILRSENIALSVIKELRLTEDPEFVG